MKKYGTNNTATKIKGNPHTPKGQSINVEGMKTTAEEPMGKTGGK